MSLQARGLKPIATATNITLTLILILFINIHAITLLLFLLLKYSTIIIATIVDLYYCQSDQPCVSEVSGRCAKGGAQGGAA